MILYRRKKGKGKKRERERESLLGRSKLLQALLTAIPDIRVATKLIRIGILPDRVRIPSLRRASSRPGPAGKDKRVLPKVPVVTGALGPPAGGGVDHGVATRGSLVCLAEFLDPGGHGGRGEAVAAGLEIEHARQGLAIAGPAAAVGDEVLGLGLAGAGAGLGEVVSAADELGLGGAGVVGAEDGIGVGGALGGLFC